MKASESSQEKLARKVLSTLKIMGWLAIIYFAIVAGVIIGAWDQIMEIRDAIHFVILGRTP